MQLSTNEINYGIEYVRLSDTIRSDLALYKQYSSLIVENIIDRIHRSITSYYNDIVGSHIRVCVWR